MTNSTNDFEIWLSFQKLWSKIKAKPEMEDFFRDFWSEVEPESKKEKLEQEILTLRRREEGRKWASFTAMVPFAVFMAIELEAVCSHWVLLGIISGALGHIIIPFTALSLICALYLIYNNHKIKKKEQELRDIENEKGKGENNTSYSEEDYLNCVDAVTTTLVVIGGVIGEALSQGIIEDTVFLVSNLVGLYISFVFYRNEHEKGKENSNLDEKSEKKTNNMSAAKLMLAGSSVLLVRRIMLIALASSLNPAVGPALGLIGIACFMIGYALTINSYSKKLKDVKVSGISGKGVATGAASNTVASGKTPQSCGAGEVAMSL